MTKLEICSKLLRYYKKHYKVITGMRSLPPIKEYLRKYHIQYGICNCSYFVFKAEISKKKWVDKYKVQSLYYRDYWGPCPAEASTKAQVLKALQIRIDILITIVKS